MTRPGTDWIRNLAPRLIGIALLAWLVSQVDFGQILEIVLRANFYLISIVIILIIPMIVLKAYRWRGILETQSIRISLWFSTLVYFSCMFIGLLTPGRLGEFSKVFYLTERVDISGGRALSSVLLDRLFDLYLTLLVGAVVLIALTPGVLQILMVFLLLVLMVFPVVILTHQPIFERIARMGLRFGVLGKKLFSENGWLTELSQGVSQLGWRSLVWTLWMTVLAYVLYFYQCFMLAQALHIDVGFLPITFAVSLGGLVTLIPISFSGLGTREAAIVAYLGAYAIEPGDALSFSLLVFAIFYLIGGVLGMVSWMIHPLRFDRIFGHN